MVLEFQLEKFHNTIFFYISSSQYLTFFFSLLVLFISLIVENVVRILVSKNSPITHDFYLTLSFKQDIFEIEEYMMLDQILIIISTII